LICAKINGKRKEHGVLKKWLIIQSKQAYVSAKQTIDVNEKETKDERHCFTAAFDPLDA
jgi:hypothetical protein